MKSNALIKDCVDNINFKNSLIFVNGKKHNENYRLKDKDVCTIRQFPSNEDVGNGFLQAGGWILDPIGSVVTGAVSGEWGGTYYGIKVLNERMNSLKDSLDNSGSSVTDTDSIPTISGCKNQSSLGKVVPIILGKTKYTPCYIGMPYHSIAGADGETEYFTGLYQLGYNDLRVQDVKLGIYDLSSNVEDVRNGKLKINTDSIYNNNDYGTELEIKQDGSEVSLYSQKVIEEDRNVELAIVEEKSLNVPCFSAKYPHKVEIEIQFQGLVKYNDKNEAEDTNVEIEIKMSRDGGETYEPFANFTNTNTDGLVKTDNISNYVTKFTGKKDKVLRYVASRPFSWSDVKDIKNNRIEFVVCRKTKPESKTNERSQVYLTRIRTWCYDRKESVAQNKLVIQSPQKEKLRKKTARLGFRIRTGKNEIYNVLDELNCTLTSKAKIWDSSTKKWSKETYPTNNIASVILMLMQSFRGNKSFPDSKIDFESFGKFYEFCERKGLKCNGALAKETKTYDAINNLLSIGRGLLVLNGSRYGIAIDDFQENPVMVLNSQNILSLNYSKAFNEEIHGYEATFINALNDYQEDTMIVTDSEHTSTDDNLILEKINITYISDPEQLHKHLLYLLACRKLRNENWNAKLSVDGYLIEIGNLVSIQEESLLVGIGNGGEIKNLVIDGDYITGIHVDNVFDTTDTSKVYGISVNITLPENYDGNSSVATYELKNLNVKSNYLEFATPLHLDNELLPSVGDVISFGIYNKITADGICQSKKENNDGTFNFEFIPYQEGVYNSDTGVIPDFISNVTSVKEKASVIPETKVTLEELNKGLENVNQTIEDALANIGVDTRIGDITSADAILEEHQIQIKLNIDYDNFIGNIKDFIYELSTDNGITWNEIKRVNSDIYNYTLPSAHRYKEKDYFANWKLRVKAQSQYDTYSENWFEFDIDTSNYGTWIPPRFDYNQVIAIANEQGINVNLNNKFPSDVKLYGSYNTIVEFSRDGEEWIEVKDNYILFDRNIDGYPEKEQVEQYRIRVHRKSYLVDHPLEYTEKYVDATDYGTWIVQEPVVNTGVSGRTITLNIEQQRADGLQPYGVVKYKVQVKRVTPREDTEYYCPAQTLNPYDSEDNYKDVTSSDNYILVTNSFRQTMPLSGQNATEPLPVDTMYKYRISAVNIVTKQETNFVETENITALATSVKDIVANAITTTKLADNCVTVDKIAVDTLVANESFMNELTAGIVNTGELSAEQISVYDFGYISGNNDNLKYKYLDKNGNEQTLTVQRKELFFGNRGYSDFSAEGIDKSDFIKMYEGATGKQLDISVSQFKASYQNPNNLDLFYKFVLSQGSLDADINMFKLNIHSTEGMGVGGLIKSDGAFTIRTAKDYILHLNSTTEDGEVYLPNAIFSRVTGNSFIAATKLQNCTLDKIVNVANGAKFKNLFNDKEILISEIMSHVTEKGNPHETKITNIDGLPEKLAKYTRDIDDIKDGTTVVGKASESAICTGNSATASKATNDSKGNAITSYTKSPSLATNIVTTQSGATAIASATYKHLNLLLKKTDGNSTTTNMSDVNILQSAYSTSSGYVKFANGLIIQWGQSTSSSSNSREIPFSIGFSNTNYRITGTQILTSSGGSNADKSPRIYSKATTSAYVWTSDKAPFDWVAVGY